MESHLIYQVGLLYLLEKWLKMYYPFFLPELALALPAEWLAFIFIPLGLPEGIWSCLGNI